MNNTLGPFPPSVHAPRPQLTPFRWQSVTIDTYAVGQPIEIPIAGRRVITSPGVGYVPYDLLDSADNSVIGAYAIDPICRFVLSFDAVCREQRVIPALGSAYLRLIGTGVYVPMGSPAEFLVPFRRLFLECTAYQVIGFPLPQLILDIETFTEAEGDRV